MKKYGFFILAALFGGMIALGGYRVFFENPQIITSVERQPGDAALFVPTTFNRSVSGVTTSATTIDFSEIAEKSIHSVVHVKNTSQVSTFRSIRDLFNNRQSIREEVGTGSGVIISPDGYIITNNHVIDNASEIQITTEDNKIYDATLIGFDKNIDIALLKIQTQEELPYMTFGDSDTAKIGEWVLAVGNPFNLNSTVTAGIISAKSRDLSGQYDGNIQAFIQTDAAINPGNSGGALVNTNGELIGINSAITSMTGSFVGYSFAVPSNIARKVVEDLLEFGNVRNGILGVSGRALNSAIADSYGISETEGFYVNEVENNSGAQKAGIKTGDVITQIGSVKISKFSDLKGYLNSKRPKDVVNVKIHRQDQTLNLAVKLSGEEIIAPENLWEMELSELPRIYRDQGFAFGVLIKKNDNIKLVKEFNLDQGYVITKINDIPIRNITDIRAFKSRYGDSFTEDFRKIELLSPQGEKFSIFSYY